MKLIGEGVWSKRHAGIVNNFFVIFYMKHIQLISLIIILKSDFVVSENLKSIIWFDSLKQGSNILEEAFTKIKTTLNGNKIL